MYPITYQSIISFVEFTPCKAEQPLQGIELLEKKKIKSKQENMLRKNLKGAC